MSFQARRLRPSAAEPPELSLSSPVVRVQPRFGKTFGALGSGFLIEDWPSSIITARHVVVMADGRAPSDVLVFGLSGGKWTSIATAVVSFPEGGGEAPDVAIVRVIARIHSPLKLGQFDDSTHAEILGFPLKPAAPARSSRSPKTPYSVVATEANRVADEIVLKDQGVVGMSGGPIIASSTGEGPPLAVGIYLGPRDTGGGRAFVLASDAVIGAKDAAVQCL